LNISQEGKEVLTHLSPLIHSYFSVDKLYKGQLVELSTILDSFYTTITNYHLGVEVGGSGESRKWQVFPHVEVDTARRPHMRPIQALDITNSSQFDGQTFCPVM